MPDLAPDEYARLKASIAESGVLVPVELDENGAILDGHHRVKAWNELLDEGAEYADYPTVVRAGLNEAQKRNHARTLNIDRRQLSREARDQLIVEMRRDGMTLQGIADAVGVSYGTAYNTAQDINIDKVTGKDGKSYPTSYAPRAFVDDGSDPYPQDDEAFGEENRKPRPPTPSQEQVDSLIKEALGEERINIRDAVTSWLNTAAPLSHLVTYPPEEFAALIPRERFAEMRSQASTFVLWLAQVEEARRQPLRSVK